jgi:TRAP-type C4-dicarboxylate transport system substrate-binding protein
MKCFSRPGVHSRTVASLIAGLAMAVSLPCWAQAEPQKLRVVGGLAGVNQYVRHEEPFWTQQLLRLSGGTTTAEIVPFDRAGIRGEEMLRLMQLGVVPFGTVLFSSVQDPELSAGDLAGLNPNMPTLRKTIAAFRPYLRKTLRERYNVELLAIYVYPAQVTYCKKPLKGMADLAGRRTRTSSPSQSDLIEALGGIPVRTGFAEIVANMRSDNIDCAITGTMSGNTIGLHEMTTHIHSMSINWGLSLFGANASAWNSLRPELRALLLQELPKLEQGIWAESDRETGEGIACNIGADTCSAGRKGKMIEVRESQANERRWRELFASKVLAGWIQRCGSHCAQVWNETIGPVAGVEAQGR